MGVGGAAREGARGMRDGMKFLNDRNRVKVKASHGMGSAPICSKISA